MVQRKKKRSSGQGNKGRSTARTNPKNWQWRINDGQTLAQGWTIYKRLHIVIRGLPAVVHAFGFNLAKAVYPPHLCRSNDATAAATTALAGQTITVFRAEVAGRPTRTITCGKLQRGTSGQGECCPWAQPQLLPLRCGLRADRKRALQANQITRAWHAFLVQPCAGQIPGSAVIRGNGA